MAVGKTKMLRSSIEFIFKKLLEEGIHCSMIYNYCSIPGMRVVLVHEGQFANHRLKKWDNEPIFSPVYRISVDEKCFGMVYKVVKDEKVMYLSPNDIIRDIKKEKKEYKTYNEA